jgi:hypothetical protein
MSEEHVNEEMLESIAEAYECKPEHVELARLIFPYLSLEVIYSFSVIFLANMYKHSPDLYKRDSDQYMKMSKEERSQQTVH